VPHSNSGVFSFMEPDWKAIAVEQSTRLNALEQAQDKATIDSSLTSAINSHPVHDNGRDQLVGILRHEVTLVSDGSGGKIAMARGKPVAAFVAETLAQPTFSHFMRDARQTGSTYAPGAADNQAPPKTLAEAITRHLRAQTASGQDGRTNPRLPFPMQPVSKKE
jgi:hypothetical protein